MGNRVYISSLTGIRAIAAYMVFLHHYASSDYQKSFLSKIFLEFHTGVVFFFVLSGFLIAFRYYHDSKLDYQWFKKYFISRLARIYPLLILVTLITLIFIQENQISNWFLSLTLLKGFSPEDRFVVISQTWSLTVEMVFYFLAPFIFIVAKKKGNLLLQFILIFIIGIFISTYNKNPSFESLTSENLFMMLFTFFGRSFEFFIGIFLALFILKDSKVKIYLKNKKYFSSTLIGITFVISIILILTLLQSPTFRFGSFSPWGIIIHNFLLPVSIAIFFFGIITETTLLSRIFGSWIFDILGKSSYAFYLIHLGVFPYFLPEIFQYNTWLLFIGLNIFAILLYYFFEKPMNAVIRGIG